MILLNMLVYVFLGFSKVVKQHLFLLMYLIFFKNIIRFTENCEVSTQGSHMPHTQFLLLASYVRMACLL